MDVFNLTKPQSVSYYISSVGFALATQSIPSNIFLPPNDLRFDAIGLSTLFYISFGIDFQPSFHQYSCNLLQWRGWGYWWSLFTKFCLKIPISKSIFHFFKINYARQVLLLLTDMYLTIRSTPEFVFVAATLLAETKSRLEG